MRILLSSMTITVLLSVVPTAVATAGTVTATAKLVNPGGKCPVGDHNKTAKFTGQGCTKGACTSAKQTAMARLKAEVDAACDTFIRAPGDCVRSGCAVKK